MTPPCFLRIPILAKLLFIQRWSSSKHTKQNPPWISSEILFQIKFAIMMTKVKSSINNVVPSISLMMWPLPHLKYMTNMENCMKEDFKVLEGWCRQPVSLSWQVRVWLYTGTWFWIHSCSSPKLTANQNWRVGIVAWTFF